VRLDIVGIDVRVIGIVRLPLHTSLQVLIQDIVAEGRDTAKRMRSQGLAIPSTCLMYKWHGKAYLGAAHGLVGVLQVCSFTFRFHVHVHTWRDPKA
jgi:hypothetical protein